MTLYLFKVHLKTFLSIPVKQKCQILSCDTLVANERYMFRDWNKHIWSSPPAAMGKFNIFWNFRLKFTAWLQFYWLLFALKFCIWQHTFSQEGVYVSGKREWFDYTTYTRSKTVEYGVLKNLQHSSEIGALCTDPRQRIGNPFLFEKVIAAKNHPYLCLSSLLYWDRENGIAGFSNVGRAHLAYSEKKSSSRAWLVWSYFRAYSIVRTIRRPKDTWMLYVRIS